MASSTLTASEMKLKRKSRWFFGGIASSAAACITHPLDLIKVHMQTQQEGKLTMAGQSVKIVRTQGFLALYNGLSASILRQATYSTTRFGIYEVGKTYLTPPGASDISFLQKVGLAGFAGACGGFVGTPGDMINVRMQNDIKLPPDQRRNYKHAIDGVFRILREEGLPRLFSGASTATTRAIVVTIGQLSFYDQVKVILLGTGVFGDNVLTHFLSSLSAGAIATFMTQPLDVIKTRQMNAKPGEFKSLFHLITYTARLGPSGFFKGFVPAFVRLGPHTIFLFLILEQLRANLGYLPAEDSVPDRKN
ncbi:mitochondrial dicarboxylate carrier [Folsomia candida]|uniref:Mitochondrial dicarboxylate carrier n=1 Tax=Folsomia candida TaxID=158441 RepID=A0A226DDI2_FOLCA|nr:mitochondrial dicarboxylate carrier [Folsomia candida]OXA43655.1 Mitochondrial dicarboxylate carrier [Folsomia candida]